METAPVRQLCRNGCGRQTPNASGYCSVCVQFVAMIAKRPEDSEKKSRDTSPTAGSVPVFPITPEKERGEKKMATNECTKEIEGKKCGRPVQKEGLCYACYTKKHGKPPFGKAAKDNNSQVSRRKPSVSTKRDGGPEGPGMTEPEKLAEKQGSRIQGVEDPSVVGLAAPAVAVLPDIIMPETYTVAVDFSRLPKLHGNLKRIAEEEIRTPGDQLLYMLRHSLAEMEEKA